MNPPPVVCVVWEDAKAFAEAGAWVENKPREYKPHLFCTVGFLTLDEEQGVHITGSWHADIISPPDQIPRGMIRSITYLQPVPEKRRRK